MSIKVSLSTGVPLSPPSATSRSVEFAADHARRAGNENMQRPVVSLPLPGLTRQSILALKDPGPPRGSSPRVKRNSEDGFVFASSLP